MDERRGAWRTFVGWNADPTTWRDVYVRTLSGIALAIIVVFTGALLGYAKAQKPAAYIVALVVVVAAVGLSILAVQLVRLQLRLNGVRTARSEAEHEGAHATDPMVADEAEHTLYFAAREITRLQRKLWRLGILLIVLAAAGVALLIPLVRSG